MMPFDPRANGSPGDETVFVTLSTLMVEKEIARVDAAAKNSAPCGQGQGPYCGGPWRHDLEGLSRHGRATCSW